MAYFVDSRISHDLSTADLVKPLEELYEQARAAGAIRPKRWLCGEGSFALRLNLGANDFLLVQARRSFQEDEQHWYVIESFETGVTAVNLSAWPVPGSMSLQNLRRHEWTFTELPRTTLICARSCMARATPKRQLPDEQSFQG